MMVGGKLSQLSIYAICLLLSSIVTGFHVQIKRRPSLMPLASKNRHPEEVVEVSRRDALWQGATLASLIAKPVSSSASEDSPKTIVITGANSGIGFEASRRLAAQGNTIVLACRTGVKAQQTLDRLGALGLPSSNLIAAECDLASLASISRFVESLVPKTIDVLCLNAGIARNTAATDCKRTEEGFELTVGTNHFGHFYLQHLLTNRMAEQGRIVVTASGVHDPDSPGGAQGVPAGLGDLKGLQQDGKSCEMIDGSAFNADKAYKDSKVRSSMVVSVLTLSQLCNVFYARELQKRLANKPSTQGIVVNSFNPGLIVGTGLFRDQNPVFTKLFEIAATDLLRVGEKPDWGGGCLSYMTQVNSRGQFYSSAPGSSKYGDEAYGNQFSISEVSKEARDDAKAQRLWDLTAKELGIQV